MPEPTLTTSRDADFSRTLLLAKAAPAELRPPPPVEENLLARHIAAMAAPERAVTADPGRAAHGLLVSALRGLETPRAVAAKAGGVIRRSLRLDCAGAYWVEDGHPDRLTLIAAEGLDPDFCDTARLLPLWDFADIADMPYNGDRLPCCGDFFAPVAAAYGVRAWLVASLADPLTAAVRGALLLGSRDPRRLEATEAARVLSLTAAVAEELSERFPLH